MEISPELLDVLKKVVDEAENTKKPEEAPQDAKTDENSKVEETKTEETKTDEVVEEPAQESQDQPTDTQPQQEDVYVDVDNLVTKDTFASLLTEALAPLLARMDATDKQVGDITDRFVGTDVGAQSHPKGETGPAQHGETFDSYMDKHSN